MKKQLKYYVPQLFDDKTKDISCFDLLLALNDKLKQEADAIFAYISSKSYSFEIIDSIVTYMEKPNNNDELRIKLRGQAGIYVFVASKDFSFNASEFNLGCGAKTNRNGIVNVKRDDVLYVGKTDSMLQRMNQHFQNGNKESGTGSLKLLSDSRKFLLDKINIFSFCFKKDYKDNYNIIAAEIESWCHNIMQPLIGSPRV